MSGTMPLPIKTEIREVAHLVTGAKEDYDPLLEQIGDAHFVLLGAATQGTHEFYVERAKLTRRLIEERGFSAVALEAGWPAARRVFRYVQGTGGDHDARAALQGFGCFPQWVWRNAEMLEFVQWLRQHNAARRDKIGFYGLDLYNFYASLEGVLKHLELSAPETARRARYRFGCLEQFNENPEAPDYAASIGMDSGVEDEIVRPLRESLRQMVDGTRHGGRISVADRFLNEQGTRLLQNAEAYYRALFREGAVAWTLRDKHMAETLEALAAHLNRVLGRAKIVVWAHNSRLEGARATPDGGRDAVSLGRHLRNRHGADVHLAGFTTYTGMVAASSGWEGAVERHWLRPALRGSYEELLHETGLPCFLLNLRQDNATVADLKHERPERAIGAVYRPEAERVCHYFHAVLPQQFDSLIHIDETSALEPLERGPQWNASEMPERIPFAT